VGEAAEARTRELDAAKRERRWPNVRPRDAATLVVLDRTGPEPKVLMGRRHPGHVFMPGVFVFPGGRIELGDRHMPVAGVLSGRSEAALSARVSRPPHSLGRALALAAIRETYEETGLMLGTREHGPPETAPEGTWTAFRERGVLPDLEPLQVIARAVTPPRRPRRFDTRFFAVDRSAVVEEVAGIVGPGSELSELAWFDLAAAQALEIPAITKIMLKELDARLAAGFGEHLPVPYYREVRGSFVREEV
jgi:8-oxo-dGTP pyrophosphatase MutT (NUDIX family)